VSRKELEGPEIPSKAEVHALQKPTKESKNPTEKEAAGA